MEPVSSVSLNAQRAPWWRRVLRWPFCLLGAHKLGYKRKGRVFENWQRCVYCGRMAYNAIPPAEAGEGECDE